MTAELLRPTRVCGALLAALDASDGRRKKRKRDQTPDAIGLAAKRRLLECAVRDDPEPGAFEEWLLQYIEHDALGDCSSAASAMARAVLEEWRLAHAMRDFAAWLESGAPSADSDAPAGARTAWEGRR